VSAGTDTCPACGERASALSAREYKEKLLHALFHPLADVRLRAIIALGLRAEEDAIPALVACALRHPTDLAQGLEIVSSLSRMKAGHACASALRDLADRHPATVIRRAATASIQRHRA
jgi:HEAT repeat protein